MIYVIIGIGLLFIAIGNILTLGNAKYLLSGYNTMFEEERKNVDIEPLVTYFNKFHIYLGISFLTIGLALIYLIGENAGGVFLGVYPILAYIYFFWSSSSTYANGLYAKWTKVVIFILTGTLVFVIGLFWFGFKEDKLMIHSDKIEIEGFYGEELTASAIESIELIDQLPKITMKTNGFALGNIHKGYFRTNDGETIKLITNSENPIF